MFVQRRSAKVRWQKLTKAQQSAERETQKKPKRKPCLVICVVLPLYSLCSHSKQVRKTKERLGTALALPHTLPALQPRPDRFGWPAAATMRRACRPLIHTHSHTRTQHVLEGQPTCNRLWPKLYWHSKHFKRTDHPRALNSERCKQQEHCQREEERGDGVGVALTPRRHDDCDLTVSLDVIQAVFDETQTETHTLSSSSVCCCNVVRALGRIRNVPS